MLIKNIIPELMQQNHTRKEGELAIRILRKINVENSAASYTPAAIKKRVIEVLDKAYPGILGEGIQDKLKFKVVIHLDDIDLDWLPIIDAASEEKSVVSSLTRFKFKVLRWCGYSKLVYNLVYKLKLEGDVTNEQWEMLGRAVVAACLVASLKDKRIVPTILDRYEDLEFEGDED